MKLERLLKVPRPGRTIQLVVNIPEPSPAPAVVPPPPKPTGWVRIWGCLKVAGPSAVATAAIIISILSLQGQTAANRDLRQANVAAATARQRQNAEQVSFLQPALPQAPSTSLRVENLAATPIYSVTFWGQAAVLSKGSTKSSIDSVYGGKNNVNFTLLLGDIPACSSGTIDIVPAASAVIRKKTRLTAAQIGDNPVAVSVDFMTFADSSGVAWQYAPAGGLQQLVWGYAREGLQQSDQLPANTDTPDGYLKTNYKDAVGCS